MAKRALISVYDKSKITELAAGFQLRMPNALFGPGGTEQMPLWECRRGAHGNPLAGQNALFGPGGSEQSLLPVCRRVAHGSPLAGIFL
jgi:hypothetical protein